MLPDPARIMSCGTLYAPGERMRPILFEASFTICRWIIAELVKYKERMLPFRPDRRVADKERSIRIDLMSRAKIVGMSRYRLAS